MCAVMCRILVRKVFVAFFKKEKNFFVFGLFGKKLFFGGFAKGWKSNVKTL